MYRTPQRLCPVGQNQRTEQMEHLNHSNAAGAATGAGLAIVVHLLQINWTQVVMNVGFEMAKVALLGVIGGVAGIVGKDLYIWAKKKYYNHKIRQS